MCPTRGSTRTRPRRAMKSPSRATSTATRHPRPLAEIDADLKRLSGEIQAMLREIAA